MKLRRILVLTAVAAVLGTTAVISVSAAEAASTQKSYGPFLIKSSVNGKCLVADTSTGGGDGAAVHLGTCTDIPQLGAYWYFEDSATVGTYRIRNRFNSRCLDADTATIGVDGTALRLWDCGTTSQANQYWGLYASQYNNVRHVLNEQSKRCLDANAKTVNTPNATVELWHCHGENGYNQDWYLV